MARADIFYFVTGTHDFHSYQLSSRFFYSNLKRHTSEYVKVYIYKNCGEWYEDTTDHRSYAHNSRSEAVVKLKIYTENKEWGPNQTRMFLGFNFTTALSCEYKCDDQSYLHHSPQFKYMKLLVFFTFYGYITNLQSGRLPVGLIAQLVERCTGVAEVLGSNPVQAWFFFRL